MMHIQSQKGEFRYSCISSFERFRFNGKRSKEKAPSLDQLVIFAGACQSHFESLIQAGANFASSPSRVNIHALRPCLYCS